MDVKKYLQRIKSEDLTEVSVANLFELQRNQLLNIRFENIDMVLGVPVSLDVAVIYEKVVNHKRGGVCYELNQLFAWLLKELGYTLRFVECNVFQQMTQKFGPMNSHIALLVELDGRQYIADVGVTTGFIRPLEFVVDKVQKDGLGTFKIIHIENQHVYQLSRMGKNVDGEEKWSPVYLISMAETSIENFRRPLDYVESKECARFYNRTLVVRYKDEQHVFLAGYTLSRIDFSDGLEVKREDRRLSVEEARDVIKGEFGIIVESEFEPREINL